MKKMLEMAAVLLGTAAAVSAGGTAYFYRRTMKRYNAKVGASCEISIADFP